MDKAEIVIRIKEAIETIDKANKNILEIFRNVPGFVMPLEASSNRLVEAKLFLENLLDDADFVFGDNDNDEH